jgi:hypothetical protein
MCNGDIELAVFEPGLAGVGIDAAAVALLELVDAGGVVAVGVREEDLRGAHAGGFSGFDALSLGRRVHECGLIRAGVNDDVDVIAEAGRPGHDDRQVVIGDAFHVSTPRRA